MAHKYQNELGALADKLSECMAMAQSLPVELAAMKLRIANELTVQRNFIANLLQMGRGQDVAAAQVVRGVSTILGVPVEARVPVTVETLKPSDPEREQYLDAVAALYNDFAGLTDEQLFGRMLSPGFEAVLRGVARRAGVEHYRDAALNKELLAAIRDGMRHKVVFAALREQAGEPVANDSDETAQPRRRHTKRQG